MEQAAQAGHTGAVYNLAVLLKNSEPGTARRWLDAAEAVVSTAGEQVES